LDCFRCATMGRSTTTDFRDYATVEDLDVVPIP